MFLGEVVGTALLVLIGDGVVAGVLLNKSKAQNSGWVVITWAWAMGVFIGVLASLAVAGGVAHMNPAVTIGLASIDLFEWSDVPDVDRRTVPRRLHRGGPGVGSPTWCIGARPRTPA